MTTDDGRRHHVRDQRRIEVTGPMIDGGIGGIRVGGDLRVTSTVTTADALGERDLRLVHAVLDAARASGPAIAPDLATALDRLHDELGSQPARRGRVRASLEQVAIHAGTAGAVFAAAQLALDALA